MNTLDTTKVPLADASSDATVRSQFQGCLPGGAVGDALGAPVDIMTRVEYLRCFGPEGITVYAPTYGGIGYHHR